MADESDTKPPDEMPQATDAPFQQFYSTFESLISKLSAPLAFAGLPLTTPTTTAATPAPSEPPTKPSKPTPSPPKPSPASIDYSQLISRAALRAVGPSSGHNPSESFYVVPTTGGTVSYAEIMNRIEREENRHSRGSHRRNLSSATNEDDFVDARSTILSDRLSPTTHRFHPNEATINGKTMEEISLENQALKHLSDTLSKRLHVFEMSAQTSSAALAQSIRSLQRSPLSTPENSRGKTASRRDGDGANKRIAELEEILRKSDADNRRRKEENLRLRDTIAKYREKWENLKAGAKARREKERESRKDGRNGAGKDAGEGAAGVEGG